MYWLTGILGLVVLFSPFVLGFTSNIAALWACLLIGGMTIIVSFIERVQNDKEEWEYWAAAFLGLLAVLSPFLFGFNTHVTATWTTIIGGLLIGAVAVSKIFYDQGTE